MYEERSKQRPYLSISVITETGLMSRSTVWRQIRDGHLEAIKIGQTVRIPREAFEAFIEAHRIGGDAQ